MDSPWFNVLPDLLSASLRVECRETFGIARGLMFEKNKIYSIHILRFFAAAAVVIHHVISGYGSSVNVFGCGVDVFFVISGVVIGMTLNSGDRPASFAKKRFIRVMPLYWIATIAYVIFRYSSFNILPTPKQAFRSFFLLPETGPTWGFIYWPGWSLAYEMLFYIVATLSLILFHKRARAICFLVFTTLSLARVPNPWASGRIDFETQMCFGFCAGLVISDMLAPGVIPDRRIGALPDRRIGTLFLIFGAFLLWHNQVGSPIPRMVAWGVPSAFLVIGAMSFESVKWIKNKWAVLGGDASYAIYLTHLTTIELVQLKAAQHSIPMAKHTLISSGFLFAAAIGVGVAFHKLIERPMLGFLRRLLLPRPTAANVSRVEVAV